MIFRKGYSVMARQLKPIHVIPNKGSSHTGTVFFFHGSGSTAEAMRYGVAATVGNDFTFPHIRVVFPTAPLQPYTPCDGELSNVWFDRLEINSSVPEVADSIDLIGKDIKQLIKEENDKGIPNNRIIVGGFSMGGGLALHTAYRWHRDFAGVFVLSSFLNKDSAVYKALETDCAEVPELLQFHGGSDDLVPLDAGKNTFDKLSSLGVKGKFIVEQYNDHSVTRPELFTVHQWIAQHLPEV